MPKTLIVYASLTGNTEEIAHQLADILRQKHAIEVEVEESMQVYAEEMQKADICIVATYTYGTDGNLPDEIEDFYDDMAELELSGKVYGVLGSGQSFYEHFCRAVDYFDQRFKERGAIQGAEPLKFELNIADQEIPLLEEFAKNIVKKQKELVS